MSSSCVYATTSWYVEKIRNIFNNNDFFIFYLNVTSIVAQSPKSLFICLPNYILQLTVLFIPRSTNYHLYILNGSQENSSREQNNCHDTDHEVVDEAFTLNKLA
jgi:hypothetical protein